MAQILPPNNHKVALLADTHFHVWNEFANPDGVYLNDRVKMVLSDLEEMFKTCFDLGITYVIHLGDVFEDRRKVNKTLLNLVYSVFEKAHFHGLQFTFVPGNHDYPVDPSSDRDVNHTLGIFASIGGAVGYGCGFLDTFEYLPFTTDYEMLVQYHLNVHWLPIALGHLPVQNFIVERHGLPLSEGVSLESFAGYERVILGHYHLSQVKGNVTYLGSFTSNNFREEGSPHGWYTFDLDTRELEFYSTRSSEFKTIYVASGDDLQQVSQLEGCYARIVHTSSVSVEAIEEVLKHVGVRGVRTELEREYKPIERIAVAPGMSFNEMVEKYVDASNAQQLDRTKLIKVGQECMEAIT